MLFHLLYIHHLEPIGFVIVSADNRSMPILGYSFDNNLILEGAPENFNWLINNYKNQILHLSTNNQNLIKFDRNVTIMTTSKYEWKIQ